MNTISDKVLDKIKKERIKPVSRWQFLLRDGGKWIAFGLLVLLMIIFLGLLWYFWSDGPWIHGGRFGFSLIFGRMPMILMSLFIFIGALTLFDFRNTGKGYRYSLSKIILILVSVVIVFGWLIYYLGMSARVDQAFGNLSFYQNRETYMREVWQKPENGLIAGEIIEIKNDNNFVLRDFSNKLWQVQTDNAIWRHNLKPEMGIKIKLIGVANGNLFITEEVRPWMGISGCLMMEEEGTCGMIRR